MNKPNKNPIPLLSFFLMDFYQEVFCLLPGCPGENFGLEYNPNESELFRAILKFASESLGIIPKNLLYLV